MPYPLVEIPDKDPERPRIINPENIDQIIPDDDGRITICFHGGSTWTIHRKETADDCYRAWRDEIARQKEYQEQAMRHMQAAQSGIVTPGNLRPAR